MADQERKSDPVELSCRKHVVKIVSWKDVVFVFVTVFCGDSNDPRFLYAAIK